MTSRLSVPGEAAIVDVLANDSGSGLDIISVGSPANGTALERPRVSGSTWQSWLSYGQNYYGSFEAWYGSYYGSSAVAGSAV